MERVGHHERHAGTSSRYWIRPSATHSESIPTTAAVEAEITYFDLDPGDFEEAIGQITVAVSSNRTWAET
jgi:hypothetical protein